MEGIIKKEEEERSLARKAVEKAETEKERLVKEAVEKAEKEWLAREESLKAEHESLEIYSSEKAE
eukprot:8720442-Ditylum_brightwellii.AAC.1